MIWLPCFEVCACSKLKQLRADDNFFRVVSENRFIAVTMFLKIEYSSAAIASRYWTNVHFFFVTWQFYSESLFDDISNSVKKR
jgi:hypothetical protein